MTPSENCINLIKKFEGFKAKSYLDPVGIPTIGFGTTFWTDGSRVKLGQEISMENATKLIVFELAMNADLIPDNVNQNQFDALCSFIYNVGPGNFKRSTLIKKLRVNPDDPSIRDEFMKWTLGRVRGSMVQLPGLVKRRKAEADLYFTDENE